MCSPLPCGLLKEMLLEVGGPLAVKLAARMVKAKVKPLAKPHGTWSLLEPVIDSVDSVEELLHFAENPERFVSEQLLGAAIAALKHVVQPLADRVGLPWPVVAAVVDEIDELEELQAAIADPDSFALRVARGMGEEGVRLAVKLMKAKLESLLLARGLGSLWKPLEQIIDPIDSVEVLMLIARDPEGFLRQRLLPAAITALKSAIRPRAERAGLPWPMVEAVVDEIDEFEELQTAIADPNGFTLRVVRSMGEAGVQLICSTLKTIIHPMAIESGAEWSTVESVIADMTLEELVSALDSPQKVLAQSNSNCQMLRI
ncbi:hypothetical protein AB1Y20_000446 [Prymnesium parvum]|uniref:Uncharacterized protein n=1 Tax=Prymnesium parvum TaxID=97485 RepID=A0AB34K5D3_PRYPA